MDYDKTDTCRADNVISHPTQHTLRQRLLLAVDRLGAQPAPGDQHVALLKIIAAIMACQLLVSLVSLVGVA